MRLTVGLVILGVLASVSACGTAATPDGGASATAAIATATPPRQSTASPAPTRPPLTADRVKAALEAGGFGATDIVVFTAESDPNKLLGRPSQYTGKLSWKDPRGPNDTATLEIFGNLADLQARFTYIDAIFKSSPLVLQWMWKYDERLALLRVPKDLTPDQAKFYEDWLKTL